MWCFIQSLNTNNRKVLLMSNQNYTIESVKTSLTNIISRKKRFSFEIKTNDILYSKILELTGFINPSVTLCERIYCILNDIHEVQICPTCKKNPVRFISMKRGYSHHCCPRCSKHDSEVNEKQKRTCFEKYGCENPGQDKMSIEKRRQTNIKRFGTENPMKSKQVREKFKNTMQERYGVEHALQSKELLEKSIQTCLKNNGVKHPLQSKDIQEKLKNTCMDIYGTKFANQSEIVKQKIIQTNMSIYGCKCTLQESSTKQKIKETNIKKYGCENPFENKDIQQQIKRTNIEKYGYEYPIQLDEFKDKMKQTCLERYGVDSYTKTPEFHKKSHKPYTNPKYPDMTFGSSWEFLVYDFLIENHIQFEYQPSISFEYEYDGKVHTYHPDFLINGKVYEVKGDQFFRINESTGQEEMYCPYRNPDWSDEYYQWMCEKYETKHQCMLKNNVIILRHSDIKNIGSISF